MTPTQLRRAVRTATTAVALAASAAVALAAAPSALAATQHAHAGNVTAAFSYQGAMMNPRHERLRITRAGHLAYDQPVHSQFCGSTCWPGASGSLHVLDLEHNGRPDVVLDLFSGGAHCCFIEQVFSYDSHRHTYVKTERNFWDPGATIVDLGHNGRYEFRSADDSFAYEFTAFAASGMPIQIFTFSNHRFHNVTRHYPALIARDAAAWMAAFQQQAHSGYQATTGIVAAWAADEDMLGHSAQVSAFLSAQARAGHLNSGTGGVLPSGSRYVRALQKFLHKHGYAP